MYKCDYLFNILIIGEKGVDKTPFILRFTDDCLTPDHLTTLFKSNYKFLSFIFYIYRFRS